MPYVSGSANSFADLLTALRNACTTNGWTLSGTVLHKGTCYVDVLRETAPFNLAPADSHLSVRAGNGIDGSNNLTDPAPRRAWLGLLRAVAPDNTFPDWSWPVTYHIHVLTDPDEVWLWVNYNTDFWQWLAFGQSPAGGNAGTGNWHAASICERGPSSGSNTTRINQCRVGADGVADRGGGNEAQFCPQPFFLFHTSASTYSHPNYAIHGALDDSTGAPIWSSGDRHFADGGVGGGYSPHTVNASRALVPLYSRSPNQWNSEAPLLPVQVIQTRLSNKVSLIGEFRHSRLTRNKFITPGQVVPLGADEWKVYPVYRRNAAVTGDVGSGTLGAGADHSGTFAIAIRYDGA
ncbi:hypothetical protein [Marilutibacter alkalisoli]|uniref:Uncharacterized protein n=1 Tax=Marilutibacter alkalisoli TaxID=2591633 RepID=A0A514BTU9_9GAMM|nr:hypothetical protein [Lysobacter alkalisoli]QDH70841.1 hypothetical protein FKV23_12680 [Lysobacter alkalisoli]